MAVPLQRLRIDLRDFDPAGVACLAGSSLAATQQQQPWLAMGKHLCGAATDFALLCLAQAAIAGGRRNAPLNQGVVQQGDGCRAAEANGRSERARCSEDMRDSMCGAGCAGAGAAFAALHPWCMQHPCGRRQCVS